jgi:hypothetical protein
MFKESFLDMTRILGDKIEQMSAQTNMELYKQQMDMLGENEQNSVMRLFTIVVHKFDIYRPYKALSFDDVLNNPFLHTPFIICFNYFQT